MNLRSLARTLAWCGIGLGVAEVLAPRTLARFSGLEGHEGLVRAFGVREIAAGAVILAADEPERWIWLRVAGDVLDSAALGARAVSGGEEGGRALLTTLVLSPIIALDAICYWRAQY